MAIEPFRLGNDGEAPVVIADGFSVAEKQYSAFAEREMKDRDDFGLRLGTQIDQEITA